MNITDVPIWEKYTLTIEEASKYFRIGENKLRKLAEENPAAGWVIMNGNRIQIKRKQFEKFIDTLEVISTVRGHKKLQPKPVQFRHSQRKTADCSLKTE